MLLVHLYNVGIMPFGFEKPYTTKWSYRQSRKRSKIGKMNSAIIDFVEIFTDDSWVNSGY